MAARGQFCTTRGGFVTMARNPGAITGSPLLTLLLLSPWVQEMNENAAHHVHGGQDPPRAGEVSARAGQGRCVQQMGW